MTSPRASVLGNSDGPLPTCGTNAYVLLARFQILEELLFVDPILKTQMRRSGSRHRLNHELGTEFGMMSRIRRQGF